MRRRWALVVAAVVLGLAACSNSSSSGTAVDDVPRKLTQSQAQALAGVLYRNYVAEGAEFSLAADFPVTGERIEIDGRIDWATHTGSATVAATGSESYVTDVTWTPDKVYERVPALDELVGTAADGTTRYVARRPAPRERKLDALLGVISGLAAPAPDNPQLLRQEPTARYLDRRTVAGNPVDVYGYQASTYLIDDSGQLQQLDINASDDGRRVTVHILDIGRQHIDLIDANHSIGVDELAPNYPPEPDDASDLDHQVNNRT